MSDEETQNIRPNACIPCRKRKRKCSKDEPCQACIENSTECYYLESQKRGAKVGALEALRSRVDQLESLIVGQSMLLFPDSTLVDGSSAVEDMNRIRAKVLNSGSTLMQVPKIDISKKRVRSDSDSTDRLGLHKKLESRDSLLPPEALLLELCDIYFKEFHPWIPIIHEASFRNTLKSPNRSTVLLQAITAIAIRLADIPPETAEYYSTKCRESVILTSMDRFSIETLKSIIIIAYDTIGNGRGPRSWSVVASVTRLVEQLGLSEEEDYEENQAVDEKNMASSRLLNKIGFLSPSRSPAEREERRRIFWAIFQMDRFCSVSTGWNTSLTNKNIRRRLPIDGAMWKKSTSKCARYFYGSDINDVDPSDVDDRLGGYAYLIEATDCLSRVVDFLLERFDFSTGEGLRLWFDKFHALESMLTRWKTFLPEKWQVVTIRPGGGMDENLTLAHVTYNTTVLLLHQNLAYPLSGTKLPISPQKSSAQTCLSVALEIATISAKFLKYNDNTVSPQFSLCIFVAARTILAHSIRFESPLNSSFDDLLTALREISTRWKGNTFQGEDLAGNFVQRLQQARNLNSPIDTTQAVLDEKPSPSEATLQTLASPPFVDTVGMNSLRYFDISPDQIDSLPFNLQLDHIFTWAET